MTRLWRLICLLIGHPRIWRYHRETTVGAEDDYYECPRCGQKYSPYF